MNDIFISYSKKDLEYVKKFVDELQKRNFKVWIDDRIEFGDSWWNKIVKKIDECPIFIVLMSQYSNKSKWVHKECMLAVDSKEAIFPVLINGKNFPLFIDIQYTNLLDYQMPSEDFYNALQKSLIKNNKTNITNEGSKSNLTQENDKKKEVLLPKPIKIEFPDSTKVPVSQDEIDSQRNTLKKIIRKENKDNFAICPICNANVKFKNLLEHYDREHFKKNIIEPITEEIKPSNKTQDILLAILSDNKKRSIMELDNERELLKIVARNLDREKLITCPFCNDSVKVKNLVMHYDSVHNNNKFH